MERITKVTDTDRAKQKIKTSHRRRSFDTHTDTSRREQFRPHKKKEIVIFEAQKDEPSITPEAQQTLTNLLDKKIVPWRKLAPETFRDILELAAKEKETPPALLSSRTLWDPLDMLEGKTLRRLYDYGERSAHGTDKGVMTFLLEKAEISMNIADLEFAIEAKRDIPWQRSSQETTHYVLERISKEAELLHPFFLTQSHFREKLDWMKQRTARGLYQFGETQAQEIEQDPIGYLLQRAAIVLPIDTLLTAITERKPILWERVPQETFTELLGKVAEHFSVAPAELTRRHFHSQLPFLENRSLAGLYRTAYTKTQEKDIDARSYLFEKAGITLTVENISALMQGGETVPWRNMPAETCQDLLSAAAEELNTHPSLLKKEDLLRRFEFLGSRRLEGLYSYERKTKKNPTKNVIDSLKEFAGIPTSRPTRSESRKKTLTKAFQEIFPDTTQVDKDSAELIQWITVVSELYAHEFHGVTPEEITSELYILIAEFDQKKISTEELITRSHRHSERISKDIAYSNDLSYEKPIHIQDPSHTVFCQELLAPTSYYQTAQPRINKKLQESLKLISPLQKEIIMAIAVDKKTDEETQEILDAQLSLEVIQKQYAEGVEFLKATLSSDNLSAN